MELPQLETLPEVMQVDLVVYCTPRFPDSDFPPDRAPSCLTEKRSHPASGPANTEGWVGRLNP